MLTEKELDSIKQLFKYIDQSRLKYGNIQKGDLSIEFSKRNELEESVSIPTELNVNRSNQVAAFKQTIQEDYQPTSTNVPVVAPMIGTLYLQNKNTQKRVNIGDHVQKGDVLFMIEAMKLLHEVEAPINGTVQSIRYGEGELVQYGDLVIELKESVIE